MNDEKEGFPAELIDGLKFKLEDEELYVKPSSSSMLQYLNKKKLDPDAWIPTKDIIEIKEDRALFKGRTDDLVNIGGYKVRPATVEKYIREIEGVKEVVVIGQKNPIMGNILVAKVQIDAVEDGKSLKKKIISICKQKLPEYMVPRLVQFVDALAMTQTRKLIRRSE